MTKFLNQNSLSDDIPHIVNVETGYIHADENAEGHLSKLKSEKAYVRYYFPTEKFVPLDELPIVCKFLVWILVFRIFSRDQFGKKESSPKKVIRPFNMGSD